MPCGTLAGSVCGLGIVYSAVNAAMANNCDGVEIGQIYTARHDKRIRVRVILPQVEIRLSGRVKIDGILYLRDDGDEAPTVRRRSEFLARFIRHS